MKLDGEKLLADLDDQIYSIEKAMTMTIEDEDWQACVGLTAGAAAVSEVIRAIKSGDYTIEEKG